MVERTLQEHVRHARAACTSFEADLSAFADGERTTLDGVEIARHVESCDACRAYVNALAGLSRLHLFGATNETIQVGHAGTDGASVSRPPRSSQDAGLPNGTELWGDLTRRLLEDNCARLSGVLYELGKALVAAGLSTSTELRGVQVFAKKPGSIRQLSHKGQALFREHRDLAERTNRTDGDTLTSRRAPFTSSPQSEGVRAGDPQAAFEAGRACLEQCLRLDPERLEARVYLAKYFSICGRYDRARQLLRMVLHAPADDSAEGRRREQVKFFALQQLSRVYSSTHQFEHAVELEREVLAQAERARNELFQAAALTNLSIYCVKLGRLDDAENAIEKLSTSFPKHLETVTVPAYRKAREFKQALLRHRGFLTRLRGRYPMLFAS